MITEPQRTLSSFFGTEAARNTTLEPILGGESSARLFRFSHGGQTYVLRLLAPKMSRERHHHEVGLTHATGAIEVGPRVRFVASDESAIVYDYTPGRTISLRDVKQVPVLDHLAHQLSRLHRLDESEIRSLAGDGQQVVGFLRQTLFLVRIVVGPWSNTADTAAP